LVTDDQPWEAPGSPERIPAPAGTAPTLLLPPSAPATGWTPPPRPGLVPLRPLGLGAIIGASFGTLRRNPLATYGPALLVALLVAVLRSIGTIALLGSAISSISSDTSGVGDVFSGISGSLLTFVGSALLDLAADQLVLALVALAVAGSTVGERRRPAAIWRRTRGRRAAILGWGALVAAAGVLGVGLTVGAILAFAAVGGAGPAAAILIAVVAVPGGLVLWSWLTTKLAFVAPALVVERLRMRAAIVRSWRLTRRAFWRIFGIRLLVSVMLGLAGALVTLPVRLIASFATTLLLPNGATDDQGRSALIITTLVTQVGGAFVAGVVMVLGTATTALLYLDARMRKEGLDLELAHYVEHPPGTRHRLPDPFRRPEHPA
jgi:hypothetical protein